MSILDADIDFDGNVDTVEVQDDFDQWMNEMLAGETDEVTYLDAEDADWNENIFLGEDEDEDEDEDEQQVEAPVQAPAPTKTRDAKACREWARANGYKVGNRGVIAESIWDAYLAS